MRKIRVMLVLMTIFFVMVSSNLFHIGIVKQQTSLADFTDYLDQRIPELMEDYHIAGVSIALIQKGETAWTQAYGYADKETGRKMTVDTYCRAESISKSVTAWGVMQLVEQGKIELDKPVKDYLKTWYFPESGHDYEKITVKQLLSNSAGMPLGDVFERYSPAEKRPSLKESLAQKTFLMQEPGLSFAYSNVGYNLLELLIEEVTGRHFSDYMREEILGPLGMYQSSFDWSEDLTPAIPVGYDMNNNPIPVYVYPEKGAGGLLASVNDIATFITAGMTDFNDTSRGVLSPISIDRLYTPVIDIHGFYGLAFESYGLGHFVETLPNGSKAVSHGGQGGGCMTHFYSIPETGEGIVILTNSQRSWPFFAFILSDWAEWCGFDSVGMSLIIWAKKALWAIIGLVWLIIMHQIWKLGYGFVSGHRRFNPMAQGTRVLRLLQVFLSVVCILGLWWCKNQKYLFVTAVFPRASEWLGISLLMGAFILLLSALFPYHRSSCNEKGALKWIR